MQSDRADSGDVRVRKNDNILAFKAARIIRHISKPPRHLPNYTVAKSALLAIKYETIYRIPQFNSLSTALVQKIRQVRIGCAFYFYGNPAARLLSMSITSNLILRLLAFRRELQLIGIPGRRSWIRRLTHMPKLA